MKNKKLLTSIIVYLITFSVLADSGIYICGHFRRERTTTVAALKASGYTFGILFNVHVEEDGTLTTDGEVICKDGLYVFDQRVDGYSSDKAQVDYVDDVNALLTGNTSILRLEHCIGGWTNMSYKNITNLVRSQGTGTNSILYKNFKALKDAIPSVIAINNDIEHEYDADTQSQFHIMLYDVGFKTTIAPYTNKSYWDSFVSKVQAGRPGAVDRNYLQCYGGGAGNTPNNWNIANLPIYGSWDLEANGHQKQSIINRLTNWKNNQGIVGGFYWNYNTNRDLKSESASINTVFGGGEVTYRAQRVAMVYPVKDYKAPQTDLSMGSYTFAQIQEKGFDPHQLAGIKLKPGMKMLLYTGSDHTGDSFVVTEDSPDISSITGGKAINSWIVAANKIEKLEGKDFIIRNKQSGYVIKTPRNNTSSVLQQMEADDTDYSVWTFEAVNDGLYKIVSKGSGRVLQTSFLNITSIHDGLSITQGDYRQEENQHFIVVQNDTDDSYKLLPLNSLKYVGLSEANQNTVNRAIVQRRDPNAASTDWLLVEPDVNSIGDLNKENLFRVYPRSVDNEIFIETNEEDYKLKVVDLKGRILIERNQKQAKLDLSSLAKGNYLLLIETKNQAIPFKIVKN